jgi:hypothetical protein
MNKIKRSGRLLKASFAILFREKKLLLFPLIAFALALVAASFFIAPIAFYPTGHSYFSSAHWNALHEKLTHSIEWLQLQQNKPVHVVPLQITGTGTLPWFFVKPWVATLFACAYFVSMFLATFSNVAFYHEIMQALNGNTVSIRRGFRFAAAHWRAVLLWSLFAGLVGYLINAIEERVGFLGKIITGFLGFAWSVACIFIIPTLVREEQTVNPMKLLRTSAGTLKRTWGELVIGFAGVELAFGLTVMLLIVVALLTGGAATLFICWHFHWSEIWVVAAIIGELLLLILPLGLIGSVVNPVYRCALFIYATEGVVPGSFDKELLDAAWKVK